MTTLSETQIQYLTMVRNAVEAHLRAWARPTTAVEVAGRLSFPVGHVEMVWPTEA